MTLFSHICLAAALVVGQSHAASAHDYAAGAISIIHPWIAEPPPGAPVAGGYLTIANDGDTADRLVEVMADFADRSQLHRMIPSDEGVMQMRPLEDGLEIAAGGVVVLEPGGIHIMFMRPAVPLREGDSLAVTLVFEHAGAVEVEFRVQATEPMNHEMDMEDDALDDHDDHMDMEEGS